MDWIPLPVIVLANRIKFSQVFCVKIVFQTDFKSLQELFLTSLDSTFESLFELHLFQ